MATIITVMVNIWLLLWFVYDMTSLRLGLRLRLGLYRVRVRLG